MELIPITTRRVLPPQDDLFAVLGETVFDVAEGDVVLISSKIVAISEGRCVLKAEADKSALVHAEAEIVIPRTYWKSPLTVVANAFIGTSGIDESNANGYLVLLPKDPFMSAQLIHTYLLKRFGLKDVGVVITDSCTQPLRRGAMGVSIGFWGFAPVVDHIGKEDLFGRPLEVEQSNLVDGLAAAATVVMGEVDECQPVVIARGVPNLTFTTENLRNVVYVQPQDDIYRVLYQDFIEPEV